MIIKTDLSISSCWVATEGLAGLKNQAIGLAQALGVPYVLKEVRKASLFENFLRTAKIPCDFTPPWPDMLISCGRQSAPVSAAIRRASGNKTFTVHIQDPFMDPGQFDVVIVPAHDKLRGQNVFVTQGAVHHVSREKLDRACEHFRPLLASLPRPLISVLVGGKTRSQNFSESSAHDFAKKLLTAAKSTGGGLAITFSRRTGVKNEAILRQQLSGIPSYFWDGRGENPYFGLLALADVIIVTSDSVSMVSEACSTGKPVYIYELPHGAGRHKQFYESLIQSASARFFSGVVETWKNAPLDETSKAVHFVYGRFLQKGGANQYADISSRSPS